MDLSGFYTAFIVTHLLANFLFLLLVANEIAGKWLYFWVFAAWSLLQALIVTTTLQ